MELLTPIKITLSKSRTKIYIAGFTNGVPTLIPVRGGAGGVRK
jgi:hypothetical protein